MRMKSFIFVAVLIFAALPLTTLAKYCACCSDEGQYSIRTGKLSDYESGELKRLQIADSNLFTDPGYPDSIVGISPLPENYLATFSMQNSLWKFSVNGDKKNSGTLNLAKAPMMVDYRADIHDKEPGGNGPLLYKELRFKHKVNSGTGIFKGGIKPTTEYFLVFQGRGNNCMNAEDFTHWRLEISGGKTRYAFFGKLKVSETK
jgi:hypothetical protein